MIKSFIINGSMNAIKKEYNYDDTKLAEIKYGLESLYLTITKTIVIFGISYLLGTLKVLLYIMLFYSILRLTGFGLHAKKSWHCWIGSGITFLTIPYLCLYLNLNIYFIIIISSLCSLLILKYAPADTEKRPLINKNRRKMFKFLCFATSIIYIFSMFFIESVLFQNILMFSIIIETIMILPISYKVFGLKYDNYKSYQE